MVIVEPKISGPIADSVCRSFPHFSWVRVEADHLKGGIWVFWKLDRVSLMEVAWNQQAIHFRFDQEALSGFFTTVYGSPQRSSKRELWPFLKSMVPTNQSPWLLIGDFNVIASADEKDGRAPLSPMDATPFLTTIDHCQLIDLGSSGPKFTWKGPLIAGFDRVFERLDRALANSHWQLAFLDTSVRVLPMVLSDHHPIILNYAPSCGSLVVSHSFNFLAAWNLHQNFHSFLRKSWHPSDPPPSCLADFKGKILVWHKDVFGSLRKHKSLILRRLAGIQQA
ncbi:uncharacterized protein LOC111009151 [Momordica charantia]|uniref:Uncharacterized protein LOC111009151 n=1 Tax=Momordica charantia TaxID=3673 RepID=A0A6J1C8B2_MOMCH|nr:uncharacterized protein LOC111009151 [Momordica charantia]